jgi:hypothetical protein
MEIAMPFVIESNAQKHVATTVAVKPEEEDLYA